MTGPAPAPEGGPELVPPLGRALEGGAAVAGEPALPPDGLDAPPDPIDPADDPIEDEPMEGDPTEEDPIEEGLFIEPGDDCWIRPDELFPDRGTGCDASILRTGALAGDCWVRGVDCCMFGTERVCGTW